MLNQETAKAARTDSGYILRAPRRMRVADAVAQYMRVPMGAGNSVPWDPLVAPYVIEPMNCLASREYDAVIFVGPARTGKTIGLIDGWVIYNVICDPADMLIIQMTEEKAREHSKKRLARTFRVSPEVVSRLSPNKNDNNVYDRTFLAGNYLKIGWPSVNIMSSSDYKCVALTDYDRFPEDIDGEGDAFSLASKRTTTFMSSGMTLVESSPGRDVKDVKWRRTSPHEAPPTTGILSLYNRGDRRRWYWPCPHCGEYFQPCGDVVAGFRDIADPVLASEAAYIQCPSCSGRIMPEQKRELNGRGVWLRDGESINADGSRYGDPRRSRIASFWMEGPAAAYQTLSQLVYKLLTAEQEYETTGSEETLKTVINTDWGLPYLPRASMEQRKSELLEQRAEPVPSRSVPDGVNFLVATVDVQAGRHRRFVVQVTGYGSRGERWIIDRYNITQSLRGDSDGESQRIDPASYPEDWDVLLTDVFHKSWPLASDPSQQMRLMAMAVDSGGEDGVTDNAYKFWRRCRRDGLGKRIYLFKGDKGDAFANPLSDTDWLRLAMVKDLQPGEMTADAEDDTYLDDEDADWKTTTQGQKSVGDTSATLAWRPGDSGQKKLVQLFDSGEVCAFRIKYPNGTVDVFRGWLSSLGKTIASKDVMTRTVKISGVGRPYLAEEGTETVGVTGLTVAPASASVKVGATTTLTFTVKPDGASDKAISVHSTDPQTATVTLNGLVATVKGVKQGSVSIVGMTSDGDFVAVAAVAVSAAG